MSVKNNPNYVRKSIFDYGTKITKTKAGIEYCVEYTDEEKKHTRLLWFKESGEYIRLKAKQVHQEHILEVT